MLRILEVTAFFRILYSLSCSRIPCLLWNLGGKFHIQSLPRAEMHVGLHVKCPLLLSNFGKKLERVYEI
jgi:hypothetical protein